MHPSFMGSTDVRARVRASQLQRPRVTPRPIPKVDPVASQPVAAQPVVPEVAGQQVAGQQDLKEDPADAFQFEEKKENGLPIQQPPPVPAPIVDNPDAPKFAIFLQLHNMSQLQEWKNVIHRVCGYLSMYQVDVYVTVLKQTDCPTVHSEFADLACTIKAVDVFHNRGMDIGGFLWQLDRHMSELKTIPYVAVLKFHSKTHRDWRVGMVQPFLSPKLPDWLKEMQQRNISWIGARNFAWRIECSEQRLIRDMERRTFGRWSMPHERVFIAGSIFMMSWPLLREMMNNPQLRYAIVACYQNTPVGRCNSDWPHAFERFFAYYGNMKRMPNKGI